MQKTFRRASVRWHVASQHEEAIEEAAKAAEAAAEGTGGVVKGVKFEPGMDVDYDLQRRERGECSQSPSEVDFFLQ